MDFGKAEAVRRALGLDHVALSVSPEFDDPAFSGQVLGLDD